MKLPNVDVVRLDFSNSLIIGHCPDSLKMEQIAKKMELERKEIGAFGLFDTAAPNFSTFYPDVKAEDLKPELDKTAFIYPVFRGLSEVIVHKQFNPIDFSKNGALKKSVGMLKGQTVYPNHEMMIGNELGVIYEDMWQDGYTTNSGIKIPAGINTKLKLDGKAHPTISRGIMMEPPSIHSTSVTVEFGWEQSHPSMDSKDFWAKLATFGEDGELIRRVVTEVKRYYEISLVPHGADPFAKKLDEQGQIVNPTYSSKVYNTEKAHSLRVYTFSYKEDITSLSEEPPKIENLNNMKEYLIKLAQKMSIATDGQTEAQLEAAIDLKITTSLAAVTESATYKGKMEAAEIAKTTAETALAAKVTELANITTERDNLKPLNEVGKNVTAELRTEVKRKLNVIHNNAPDAALLTTADTVDYTTLAALDKTYGTQLEAKAPLTCKECGSKDISRQTAAPGDDEDDEDEDDDDSGSGEGSNRTKNKAKGSKKSFQDLAEDMKKTLKPKFGLYNQPKAKEGDK